MSGTYLVFPLLLVVVSYFVRTNIRNTFRILLANGVPLKQIQEWLGHSDFSTTANIYAYLDYSLKLSSAQAMESVIFLPGSDDFGSKWARTDENRE